MGVFAHKIRMTEIFILRVCFDFSNCRIHSGKQIRLIGKLRNILLLGDPCRILTVDQSFRVGPPQILDHFFVVYTKSALISERPRKNTRVVFIPVIRTLHALHKCPLPLFLVADPLRVVHGIIAGSVRITVDKAVHLAVVFQHHIKSHLVTQIQEFRCRRIM